MKFFNENQLKFAVNLLTIAGAGLSAASIPIAFNDLPRLAWLLMLVALVIDSVDGTFVRLLDLSEALPKYDGERLDEYADYLTYVIAPLCFCWATGVIPFNIIGIVTGMLVCGLSALQFSRTDSKTTKAFIGWPAYWNILYFYAWALEFPEMFVVGISVFFSFGLFVPVPFVYPSHLPRLKIPTFVFMIAWILLIILYSIRPGMSDLWLSISLLFPLYYAFLSLWMYEELQ